MARSALPAIASAAAVAAAGVVVLSLLELGPLSAHVALHIALMNIAAPLLAIAGTIGAPKTDRIAALWAAGAIQIVLLWTWHVPSFQRAAMDSELLLAFAHGTMFLAALLFWALLLNLTATTRWQAILLLLLTGKLSCLLGALLVLAPRHLYATGHEPTHTATMADLNDQQLAGLLMITACPLSYVLAGVVTAAQVMDELKRRNRAAATGELPG
jgi:putative membrane protein